MQRETLLRSALWVFLMLAIIGGSGLTKLANLEVSRRLAARTPYGDPSGAITCGKIGKSDVLFLARHGYGHTIPPHEVNYRANLWALKDAGADSVVSVASVGGIRNDIWPGAILLPHQVIDYTWGRASTFFEGGDRPSQRLCHRLQPDRDVLPAFLGRSVHLIEHVANGIHDPAGVPQTEIPHTQVVGVFSFE